MTDPRGPGEPDATDPVDDAALAAALGADGTPVERLDDPDADRALAEYQEVLAQLPVEEVPPPAALEARVLDAARAARRPAVPALDRGQARDAATTSRHERRRRRRRRRTLRRGAIAAVAAAAAAVALVIALGDADDSGRSLELTGSASAGDAAVLRVDPETFRLDVTLDDVVVGELLLGADGTGFVTVATAPPEGQTYRLVLTSESTDVRLGTLDAVTTGIRVEGSVERARVELVPES